MCILCPSVSFSQGDTSCKLPANTVSISQPASSQAATEVHVDDSAVDRTKVHGAIHLDLRNDGPASLNELCASAHIDDADGKSRESTLALSLPDTKEESLHFEKEKSCLKLASPWKAYASRSFDLHVLADPNSIPSSAFIWIDSSVQEKEAAAQQQIATKGSRKKRGTTQPTPLAPLIDCVSHAKPITRSVNLLPSKNPRHFYLPLGTSLVIGLIYLFYSLHTLKPWRGRLMGGPQWSFGSSFASNFTVGTALLTLVLGGSMISDTLHYMTKTHYMVLSLLFAAILLVAPSLFSFFSEQKEIPSTSGPAVMAPTGTVRLFIWTSTLMVAAVIGQLFTVGLAMDEVRYRGYLDLIVFSLFVGLLAVAGFAACLSATRVVPLYFKQIDKPEYKEVVQKLESFKERLSFLHGKVAGFAPEQQALHDRDQNLLDQLIAREHTPPKWTMF
jgi:hypothetical protein